MKATVLLTEQHNEVRSLFKRLQSGNGHSEELLSELANSLAAHMTIEQELFYPAVMQVDEALILEGYEEHAVARFALKRLTKTAPSDRTFQAKVTTLQEMIEDHMQEEEGELFPKAEKALVEASEALCVEMKALFKKTLKLGYRHAVEKGGPAVSSATAPEIFST